MTLLDYSETIEEFKKLNMEDEIGSQEDEDDPINNLNDGINNLSINSEQLAERGKAKSEKNLEVRNPPYKKNDFGRHRNDSVDSGNCSDVSINSPSSISSESQFTPFDENTFKTKLVSLEECQQKTENLQKLSSVRCKSNHRFLGTKNLGALPTPDLVSKKTEEQKESAKILNSEEKPSNLENNYTETAKTTLEQQLNPIVLRQKWMELIVFSKEDIFSTDSKGLTIFHRLLNKPEDEHLPETLYTLMEEFKQHPSKCSVLLNSQDAILNSLESLKGKTKLLEEYFKISFIVISLLYDYLGKTENPERAIGLIRF